MKKADDAIRQANRNALPKFLLIMFCAALVGGAFGYCAAAFGLDRLAGALKQTGEFFSLYIAPWILLACAALQPILSVPLYRRAKKRFAAWDGEDEEVFNQMDGTLSIVLWLGGIFNLLALFLMGAAYAGPIIQDDRYLSQFLVVLLSFLAVLAETLLIQQRVVDLAKRMAPEKKGSIYDIRFRQKWFESCDEAEKLLIGQCAYKAYCANSTACLALWLIFTLSALFFSTGFLPILAVCLIWGVGQCAYSYWSIKLSATRSYIL
ncbi:MAG TPA: DUF3169 family protein [Candidatus Enterenecus stercoripullorum]|nr:DUF3169 family protein [Candidatus Enterenecus stercoripullorum]